MKVRLRPIVCATLLAASGGCQLARDLLPRTHTTSRSPDGRYVAFVHQELNPDPPDDHLYLGSSPGLARRLMSLAPDMDWCRTIVWSPDSRTVGFLINEQRLALFDTASGSLSAMMMLADNKGSYPGSQEARHVTVGGGMVTYDRYERATTILRGRNGIVEAPVTIFGTYGRPIHRPERFLGQQRLPVPREQLRLRFVPAGAGSLMSGASVKLVTADQRQIVVPAQPEGNGVVRVPAFDPGPYAIVEVRSRRGGAVLRNVAIAAEPIDVPIVPARH